MAVMRRKINREDYTLVIKAGKATYESPVYTGLPKAKEKVQQIFANGRWVSPELLYIPTHNIQSVQIVEVKK